jgi:large subunit ribosomal protein L23
MKLDLHSVLIQPLLTEKVTALRESSNTVGFLVHPDANRVQIKQAVETLLKVKVERASAALPDGLDHPVFSKCEDGFYQGY